LSGRLGLGQCAWLADHAVFETVLVPGTGLLELALAAGECVGAPVVRELTLAAPLALTADTAVRIQLQVKAGDAQGVRAFSLYGRSEGAPEQAPWTLHAEGLLAAEATVVAAPRPLLDRACARAGTTMAPRFVGWPRCGNAAMSCTRKCGCPNLRGIRQSSRSIPRCSTPCCTRS
jgi:acyl transferase domain-containing protein